MTTTRVAVGLLLALGALHASGGLAHAGGYYPFAPGGANGTSPHGGYADSTSKCKVCHAAHNATAGGQVLLRSSRANACVYCHLNPGTVSSKRPYGQGAGSVANYVRGPMDPDIDYNHASRHYDLAPYSGCTSCHAVHGARTIPGEKDLKDDPGRAIATPVANRIDFCRDCHNRAGGNTVAGGCYWFCHSSNPEVANSVGPEYFTRDRNGRSHIMTTTLMGAGQGNPQVAWTSSETCEKCHAAGQPYAQGNSYPHFTPNAVQFLDYGYTVQDTNLDRVCMNCHVDGGNGNSYTTGVGKSF